MGLLRTNGTVAVVGAGLTGSCVALALARNGIEVLLLEQDVLAMNRASLRNEGKVHLGFVFAKDETLATSRLMLEGGLSFAPILRDLVGPSVGEIGISTPFVYLVAHDSILTAEELNDRYELIDAMYQEKRTSETDYLGRRPDRLFRPLPQSEWQPCFSPSVVSSAFHTEELAVDSDDLARVVRTALAGRDRVDLRTGHRLEQIERTGTGYLLRGRHGEDEFFLEVEQVVNAAWERRAAVDLQLGLEPRGQLLHRLKYRAIVSLPESARGGPSATMVLGRYGDVVVRPSGTAFFSWYPVCLRGWTNALEPPRSWDAPCSGEVDEVDWRQLAEDTASAIGQWYPRTVGAKPMQVDAGSIVAYGVTDVDDPASQLHERARIGVTSLDGYHTVDTGKLTTAPMFAMQAARRVLDQAGHFSVEPQRLASSRE